MSILVTGGTGYIGSHTIVELLEKKEEVIVIDNFSNSSIESLNRIEEITGKKVIFYKVDLLNLEATKQIFINHTIDSVIHFAGLKAVGDSVKEPLNYYHNNLVGTINLLNIMSEYAVKKIVFSSSATVYGNPKEIPINETAELSTTNPYGSTKLMIENILTDISNSDKDWSISILRYFNPIGAHKSGLIGEDPNETPNNLMPYITQVAVGKLSKLKVFGKDYDTLDGTGVRDYIHVVDLAKGHIKALEKLENFQGVESYNLGTGKGTSVLELVETFEKVSKVAISYEIVDRRAGDIDTCFADVSKSKSDLNWVANNDLEDMCRDAWNWQQKNPLGYKKLEKSK